MIVTAAALAPSREAASSLPLPLIASAPSSFSSTASDSVPSSTVCDCLSDDPPAVPPVPRPAVPLLVPRKLELRSSDVVDAEGLLSEETSEDVEARAERCCDVM